MRRIAITFTLFFAITTALWAQDHVTLQFTGQDQNGQYVRLNSVLVENITRHWQEVLYYPDTTLAINSTGIEDANGVGESVRLFQNVPNPFDGVTEFALQLPEASNVQLEIYDMHGKVTATYQGSLDPGCHQFRTWLAAPQTYLLNARTMNGTVQIKMINTGNAGQSRIEYVGKGSMLLVEGADDEYKGGVTRPFNYGDSLSYKGYARLAERDFESAQLSQTQYSSELIVLPFTLPLQAVTTKAAMDISSTSARLRGSVTENPEYQVSEKGFLFADNEQMDGASVYSVGSGSGDYDYTVTNLQLATRYYYRAYAQSAIGITYGAVLNFETEAELPVVHTIAVTDTGASKATCIVNVASAGGVYVTARGVCWSSSQEPTLNDSYTNDGNGIGSFSSHLTGLMPTTTYYVRAYAVNSAGTAYGEELSFTTKSPFYCGMDTLMDYDGNAYATVEIGNQCWMKENLRTTHYADGTAIPLGTELSGTVAYRYSPNDNSANVPAYGYLYNWCAVMHGASSSNANPSGVQGICPPGWHVPSLSECNQFVNYVHNQSQYVCGSIISRAIASTSGWTCLYDSPCQPTYDPINNDATGFSLFPAGECGSGICNYGYSSFQHSAQLWSSTQLIVSSDNLAAYILRIDGATYALRQVYANAVRCILNDGGMNDSIAVLPHVTTGIVSNILSSSATCGGRVTATGGASVTARGICWSTIPDPTVNDNHTVDGNGTGRFSNSLMGLAPNTTYYVRAYATNLVGTSYGEQQSFTTQDTSVCPLDTITDYDGNIYTTVVIGNQCWMRENLRTTHYADGTAIPAGTDTSSTVAYRFSPGSQDSHVPDFGYLYNTVAVLHGDSPSNANPSGVQGVCPNGWHVPSEAEWLQLKNYVISQGQYACGNDSTYIVKSLVSQRWWCPDATQSCAPGYNPITNNTTGFSAVPAGFLANNHYGYTFRTYAHFCSSTQYTDRYMRSWLLDEDSLTMELGNTHVEFGLSVRCVRN